jgi:ribosomal protein S18 acetylase RimI-like enzyme
MTLPAHLRLAAPADLGRILPLFRAYQAHYSALSDASEEKTRDFLRRFLDAPEMGFAFVAELDAGIAGFATGYFTVTGVMAERLVHLGDLYVSPQYRRQGLATALMDAVTSQARHHGIGLVRWLSVASNTELNRWYGSLGATSGDFKLFLRPTASPADQG